MKPIYLAFALSFFLIPFSGLANQNNPCGDSGRAWVDELPDGTYRVCYRNGDNQVFRQPWEARDALENAGQLGDVPLDGRGRILVAEASDMQVAEQAREAAERCEKDTEQAGERCNEDNSPEMMMVRQMGEQLVAQMSVMTAGSIEMACSGMGKFSQMANGALAAYKGYCSASYFECSSSCKDAVDTIDTLIESNTNPAVDPVLREQKRVANASNRRCSDFSRHIGASMTNIMQMMYTQSNMRRCKETANNVYEQICKNDPNHIMCKGFASQDCNSEAGANNPVCICMKNPGDPRCASGGGGFAGGVTTSATSGAGDGTSGIDPKLGNFDIDGSGLDAVAGFGSAQAGEPGRAGGPGQRGFGGGARGGIGAVGDGQGAGVGAGAPAATGPNTKILGGYYGGGGAVSMGSGRSGSASSGGGYGGARNTSANKKVNLAAFLPGGKMDPSRALAGISGPDGITGPNTDIWKKVKTRYYSLSESFLP